MIAIFRTPELSPVPLIVTGLVMGLLLKVTRHFVKSNLHLTIYLIAPVILLYTAVTITVPPILLNQSGLQFKPYIETSNQNTYIYGTYYTSILYYTKTTPTQVFVHTTDDPRWTEGKALMPTITKDEFYQIVPNESSAVIIVPNKYGKNFIESPAYPLVKEIGKTQSTRIYKVN